MTWGSNHSGDPRSANSNESTKPLSDAPSRTLPARSVVWNELFRICMT